jgi:hypothetical protein
MAWTTTVLFEMNVEGNRKMVFGKTTTDSADDDVATGLSRVDSFLFSHSGSAVEGDSAVIKETLPNTDGNINVICTSGDVLYWLAIGL